jgi:hypothetical protein
MVEFSVPGPRVRSEFVELMWVDPLTGYTALIIVSALAGPTLNAIAATAAVAMAAMAASFRLIPIWVLLP